MRRTAFIFMIFTLMLGSRSARATPTFPDVIATTLGVPPPDCDLCHTGGVTGRGTVTTLFGRELRARGLVAYDEGSLVNGLQAMDRDHVDGNCDGFPEVDALRQGKDPNAFLNGGNPDAGCAPTVSQGAQDTIVPEYGCMAARQGKENRWPLAPLAVAGVFGLLYFRERRKGHLRDG